MPRRPTTSHPFRRAGLSRERVLAAAVALADESGIEQLSMRKLAGSLGVEAMSLYNHVPGKDSLLDGMIDLVYAEIDVPAPGGHWTTEMRARAISTRDALKRHPWAIGLMEARGTPG